MNILFVCLANMRRSRTAFEMFSEMFKENPDIHFDSCGTWEGFVEATKRDWPAAKTCTQQLIDWADCVVGMDKLVCDMMQHKFTGIKQLICWNIPDLYHYNDPKLRQDLMMRLWAR